MKEKLGHEIYCKVGHEGNLPYGSVALEASKRWEFIGRLNTIIQDRKTSTVAVEYYAIEW